MLKHTVRAEEDRLPHRILDLHPSYLILYWSPSDYNMNILPGSASRTGSCLHKEVNYGANNGVTVPGRRQGGEHGRRRKDKGAFVKRAQWDKQVWWPFVLWLLDIISVEKNRIESVMKLVIDWGGGGLFISSGEWSPWRNNKHVFRLGFSDSCCLTPLCFSDVCVIKDPRGLEDATFFCNIS